MPLLENPFEPVWDKFFPCCVSDEEDCKHCETNSDNILPTKRPKIFSHPSTVKCEDSVLPVYICAKPYVPPNTVWTHQKLQKKLQAHKNNMQSSIDNVPEQIVCEYEFEGLIHYCVQMTQESELVDWSSLCDEIQNLIPDYLCEGRVSLETYEVYSNANFNHKAVSCAICVKYKTNKRLPCGHRFHKRCLDKWIRCPICKKIK